MHNFLAASTLFYLVTTSADGKYSYVNEKFNTTFLNANNDSIGQPFCTLMTLKSASQCNLNVLKIQVWHLQLLLGN
jgi:hypothetical protein